MTENTIDLPVGMRWVRLVCRLGRLVTDSAADENAYPDLLPVGGTLTLSTSPSRVRIREADGRWRSVEIAGRTYTIRADGELVDNEGRVGVYIPDPTSLLVEPQSYTITAAIKPTSGTGWHVTVGGSTILPDVVDLVAVSSVGSVSPSVTASFDARLYALETGVGVDVGQMVEDYLVANPPAAVAPTPLKRSQPTMLTTFAPGHGWASHSPTPSVDDPAVTLLGGQSVRIESGASAQKTGLGLDLTGRELTVWVRVEDLSVLNSLQVYAGTTGMSSYYAWKVAGTTPSPQFLAGEWAQVTLPFSQATVSGTPNRAAVDTIRVSPLGAGSRAWVDAVGHVPATPARVSITFDDGYSSDLTAAQNVLTPRGLRATSFIIPERVGAAGFMTEGQLLELARVHGWDIEAHGLPDFTLMTAEELRTYFRTVRAYIRTKGLGEGLHMAWPMGYSNDATVAVAREFFRSARTISGFTRESIPPSEALRLRAVTGISSASGGVTPATVATYVDQVVANGGWLILTFHRITAGAASTTMDCSQADLATICDQLLASGVAVDTIAGVLG